VTHAAHRLTDLIDIGQLQRLCNGLSESGAGGLGVLEPDGTVLVSSGWQDICALFHRSNEVTRQACHESDLRVNQHVLDNPHAPAHIVYTCPHGLIDLAFPLVIDGEHVANILTGQFFFDDDDVDVEEFRERARRVGFDEQAYLDALARVPRIPHQRAEQTIRFMAQFVSMLAEIGLGALEHQKVHEALLVSEERYRGLAEDTPACIAVFQPDGTLTYANAAVASMAVTTPDEMVGQNTFGYMSPGDAETVRSALDSLTPRTPVETHEETQAGPDGGARWQHWTNRAFFDADGHVLRYQAVGYDITQRKLDEESLRISRQRYEAFVNATDDMAFLKDADLKYVIVNEANARFFGMSVQEVVGCTDADFMSPEAARACHDSDMAALEQQHMVVSCEAMDGRAYETRKFPVRLDAQRVGVGGYVRDVTEQRAAEEQISAMNRDLEQRVAARTAELEAVNRELESFAYSVSHDLRAPLRSIDGFSQILLEDYAEQLDDEGRAHLARIRQADQKMGVLIDGLLNLSRLSRSELHLRWVDLSELARDVAAGLRETDPARQVEFVIPDDLRAWADPALISVVLDNLLGNAWRFTGKHNTARIEVGAIAPGERSFPDALSEGPNDAGASRNAGERAFFVRDDGAGFDMTYADKLFGAFQRLHTPGQFEGTGIGLATVQRIIRRHGGHVWAEGEVEKGATFCFTLPEPPGRLNPVYSSG